MKKVLISLVFAFSVTFVAPFQAVENSIIPYIEHFESLENIPPQKYSKNQFREILEALKHKDKRIRVVSYNILFSKLDNALPLIHKWDQRMLRVVEAILEMQPDVIGVQEMCLDQLEDLLPVLEKEFSFFGNPVENDQTKEINGIFYRKDRFDLIQSFFWKMEVPSFNHLGELVMVQLKDRLTDHSFALFNTHLCFSKIERRDGEARFIADLLLSKSQEMPVILLGDLNTFPNWLEREKFPFLDGEYVLRILKGEILRDAREISLLGHLGPPSTFTNLPSSGETTAFLGTGNPGVFLDHILVSKEFRVLLHAVQPGKVGGHFPSDHMPVIVDLIFEVR